jgi:hypothetical protein
MPIAKRERNGLSLADAQIVILYTAYKISGATSTMKECATEVVNIARATSGHAEYHIFFTPEEENEIARATFKRAFQILKGRKSKKRSKKKSDW